jgi:hypothetical protein
LAATSIFATSAMGAQSIGRTVAPPQPPVVARISGVAFDSVAMRPLVGANIQLVAANDPSRLRAAITNDRGAYAIDSVGVGTYLLGYFHARLDSLGIEAPLLRVDVRTSGEVRAAVAIPSGRTLMRRFCGDSVVRDSSALFMGFVRRANGEPLATPARIRTQWTVVTLGSNGLERRAPNHVSSTSATGSFAICGVPSEGNFTARAFAGGDSSGTVELPGPTNGLLYRDIYIGAATRSGGGSFTANSVLKGNGMLRGVVKSATGKPVRGARVVMWGSGRVDSTNANGQFAMQTLPAGSYTLEARAIGYLPKRAVVDIPDGSEGVADIAMDVFVPTIDTVRVRADRNARDPFAEFDKRKRQGFGYFIDDAQLNRRNPMYMSDAVRTIPGISITPQDLGGDKVLMRGMAGSGSCIPAIFLNGLRAASDTGILDEIVNPQDVRAIEVYSRTGSTPAQFTSSNGCGSIVIWTGARRPTAQP